MRTLRLKEKPPLSYPAGLLLEAEKQVLREGRFVMWAEACLSCGSHVLLSLELGVVAPGWKGSRMVTFFQGQLLGGQSWGGGQPPIPASCRRLRSSWPGRLAPHSQEPQSQEPDGLTPSLL